MTETEWYYDSGDELPAGGDADVELWIDRVYCLDWDVFGPADWAALDATYRRLPGWQPEARDGPRWFSIDESQLYLWASVEPPGLQVAGRLRAGQWRAWDAEFRVAAARLPLRPLG